MENTERTPVKPMLYGFQNGNVFIAIEYKKDTLISVPINDLCVNYRYYQISDKYPRNVSGIQQAIKDGTNNAICGYEEDGEFYYISLSEDDNIEGLQSFKAPLRKWFKDKGIYKIFQLKNSYELTHEGLLKYKADIHKWNNELRTGNFVEATIRKFNTATKTSTTEKKTYDININLFDYVNFNHAVMSCYKRWQNPDIEYENIKNYEYVYLQSCNNGGLTYFNTDYTNKAVECWGYDFSAFYPTILYDEDENIRNRIPLDAGVIISIHNIPKKFDFGIYHAKIENAPRHLIAYSNNDYYTHTDLNFCLELNRRFNKGIKIELLGDAIVYKKTTTLYSVFKKLYFNLLELKKKYPKNQILKTIMATMWGNLCKYKTEKYTEEEIPQNYVIDDIEALRNKNEGITHIEHTITINYKDETVYTLIDLNNPYENGGIARMKPFLISYGREKIARAILRYGEENLLRVATDGLVYTVNMDERIHNDTIKYHPIKEDKNTGLFVWENRNKKRLVKTT